LKTAIFGTDKKRAGIWRDFCSTGSIRKYLKIKDNNKRYNKAAIKDTLFMAGYQNGIPACLFVNLLNALCS